MLRLLSKRHGENGLKQKERLQARRPGAWVSWTPLQQGYIATR